MKHDVPILIAEDEKQARESLSALLEDEGYKVICASDGDEAARILTTTTVEAALIDIRMPGKDGLVLLRELRENPNPPAVLIMTAYGTSAVAIEAMALGAFDYLIKPLNFDELRIQLQRAIENRRRIRELEAYRIEEDTLQESEIVGSSPAMQKLYKLIGQTAPTDSTVLIRGESGTGKEVVARALHRHSPRAALHMVKVNCASIPETLLEAELFGHERGAFTGATQRRIGKFEFADGGTIFLDEIGDLSPSTQAKMLRVLQDHCVERLGSNITIPLDVRVLAATNRDLEGAVREGRFREDLYYRLNVVAIVIPPLRERREDIFELAQVLLRRSAARLRLPTPTISEEARRVLYQNDWPGNVRELEHCLERALILSRSGVIMPEHVKLAAGPLTADPLDAFSLEEGLHGAVHKLERRLIERALATAAGNRTRAAQLLKINRRLLYDKLREHGLE
ncbi:MAG: sigma-54 dependent transcriptional regulator [Acidobacteriia bacterium]|nr:sigma-54 dependent transcriptional regulator [Terriglobia bacterium]